MFTVETASDEPGRKPEQEGRRKAPAAAPARGGDAPSPVSAATAKLTDPAWLITTLWNRKGLILLCTLIGLMLAALLSMLMTPKYVSTAQLFIDPRDLRVLQNEVSPNATGGDPTSITSYLESQARVIASDSIKSRVVISEGLDKDPEFGGEAAKTGLARLLADILPDSGAPPRDGTIYALAALDKKVSVRRGERTFVIDISVTSRDAAKAARIANGLATAYLDDQAAVRAEAAQRATTALTSRLEELRNRLRQAEEKAEKFKEANGLVGLGGGKTITDEQLSLNNAQLVAMRTRVAEAKAKYDQTRAARASTIEAGAIPEAVASNTMTALRSQLGAALSREADLLASLGSRHPSLAAAQSQVRDARRQISEELARIARAAKVEYDRAVEAEQQLARRVDQLTTRQYAAGRASVELRELEREVESSRVVYDAFLRRARETGELAGIDTTNARIISAAMPPLEKSGVSRRTVAMLGGIAGGGVGVLLALGLALLPARPRREARDEAQQTDIPHAPVAATETPAAPEAPPPRSWIPARFNPEPELKPVAPAPARTGWRRFVTLHRGETPAAPASAPPAALPRLGALPAVRNRRWRRDDGDPRSVFQGKSHLVDVLDKPKSSFAAAVHAIRTALAPEGTPANQHVLVMGVRPDSGASTLALNLALDAALSGLPAMLVDAGAGPAGLTAIYAPDAQAGLQDVVSGAAGLVRVALQDEGTGLFFLPRAGRTDLVTAAQISEDFIAKAHRFGPVIIDGAALGSDALTSRFAEAVDDIVLVARTNTLSADELANIHAKLGPQAAKIRGYVANEAR